ncbi:MAG: cyclic nucleotide-binding domain-containing protein [Desulfobacteraceae bacterium]|nr:cyclic nucleotide-binding domain-containing protein [Desulfobacteraceae bacterium]
MFRLGPDETYQDGEIIIKEGNSGDWIYVILSGSVAISKKIGGKTYDLGLLGKDDVFGEFSYFGNVERTATARAVGEATVAIIDRGVLDLEFNGLSDELRAIIVNMVKKSIDLIDKISEIALQKESRIVKTLSLAYKDRESFIRAYNGTGVLYIKTAKPLKKGEKFLVKLQLPGIPNPLKINSEVAWARKQEEDPNNRPSGMGVKFCEMNKRDDLLLKQFLKDVMRR